MIRAALALCLAAVACVGRDNTTRAADAGAPGAPACPGPMIQTADWGEVALERIPVTLRLPPGYVEKRYDVRIGDPKGQTFRGGDFQSVYVEEESGPADLDSAGFQLRSGMTDYSDCREAVGGRMALIQASRGSGTIFHGERRWPTFDAALTWPLEPGLYVTVSSSSATRAGQDTMLAIARTLRPLAER
jgi:hypothetical protein